MSQALEEKEVSVQVEEQFGKLGSVQMIMRAGYVKDYGQNKRIRRPLKEFVFIEN
jgi:hypothetical protein